MHPNKCGLFSDVLSDRIARLQVSEGVVVLLKVTQSFKFRQGFQGILLTEIKNNYEGMSF